MNALSALVFVSFATLTACSAHADSADTATDQGPVTKCEGVWPCTYEVTGTQWNHTLQRWPDGRCMLSDAIELSTDHVAREQSAPDASWTEDGTSFKICWKDGCLSCGTPSTTPEPPPAKANEKCTGTPESCSGLPAGSCSPVQGCTFTQHVKWDGSLDYTCEGIADDCKEFTDAASCSRQGCHWK